MPGDAIRKGLQKLADCGPMSDCQMCHTSDAVSCASHGGCRSTSRSLRSVCSHVWTIQRSRRHDASSQGAWEFDGAPDCLRLAVSRAWIEPGRAGQLS